MKFSGELYSWGKGRYGRLGHGDSEDQTKPKLVEALLGYRVIDVACGSGDAQVSHSIICLHLVIVFSKKNDLHKLYLTFLFLIWKR